MGEHGIPPKYQRLVQMIYQNATARIKGPNDTQSEPFDVQRGVLQGDILSPILFVLVLNSTWARTNPANGWQIAPNWLLDELSYADDCVIIEGPGAVKVTSFFSGLINETFGTELCFKFITNDDRLSEFDLEVKLFSIPTTGILTVRPLEFGHPPSCF